MVFVKAAKRLLLENWRSEESGLLAGREAFVNTRALGEGRKRSYGQ
jgi:nuclear transport factor 2 (NTF2) superfamily protein